MANYNLMGIVIENRKEVAPFVQEVLTEYGEIIKMRIGLHENLEKSFNNEGFIILNLEDDDNKIREFIKKLGTINSVRVKNIKV